eukprot:GILI01011452.1.p1 GENE.GILI01011452.1~~GILI01011452.1.p1  ORF type:complete len:1100 (-),score=244.81 GILI01011452.1:119-3418(-)
MSIHLSEAPQPIPDIVYDDVPAKGDNNFGVDLASLKLSRFYLVGEGHGGEEAHSPTNNRDGKNIHHTVESSTYVSLSPAAIEKEIEAHLNTLEPGHLYNNTAAPIGVPEPRPELLVTKGMDEVTNIQNRLAAALVVSDRVAAVYEKPRKEVLLWRRWTDIHPNPCLFGPEDIILEAPATPDLNVSQAVPVDDEEGSSAAQPDEAVTPVPAPFEKKKETKETNANRIPTVPHSGKRTIQSLKPVPLASLVGHDEHPTYLPVFQPSIMDDHFFLLGLAAGLSQDKSVIAKAFASTEHLDERGLLTIRLFNDQRVELPKIVIEGKGMAAAKGAAKRKQNRSTNARSLNASTMNGTLNSTLGSTAGGLNSSSNSVQEDTTPSTLVTLPVYATIDTLLPVSKATHDTIAPAQLDLALGRTYDAVNEFWVAFLAKAYAAIKGTYSALHGGSAADVLRALVPGQGKYVRWNDQLFNQPVVMDALRRVTGSAKSKSIGAMDAEKIERQMADREQRISSANKDRQPPIAEGERVSLKRDSRTATDEASAAEDDDSYKKVAAAALAIAAAKKNAEELWWLLQEATLANQPMLLTNTSLCKDAAIDEEDCSFGNVPQPVTDNALHMEEYHKFNWSYGVVVLFVAEFDSAAAISDNYLRAVRRRSKRNQGEIKRLVKVRSVLRSNHPDYSKLRGEWSLPKGGGRTLNSEEYEEEEAFDIQHREDIENSKVNGGNTNWSAFAQEYLQYNVAEAVEKQSEDLCWWMTMDEVCRHFNCFYSLYNTSSASLAPPRTLVDTVAALAARDEVRRRPIDPFKVKPQMVVLASGEKGYPEEPRFESSPSALLTLLKNSVADDSTAVVSDTLCRLITLPASPSITGAYPHFPHFLLSINKIDAFDAFGKVTVPEGTDLQFKSIFNVKPNTMDLGEETDDEEKSKGMGGTMTSRTGSAVDITVTPLNSLQIEMRVSVPKPVSARKDLCVQVYRVTGPFKQACVKTLRDGKSMMTFPLHTKIPVRALEPQVVSTAAASTINDTASTSSHASSVSSVGSYDGGFSKSFTFECDVNTGHYNIVVMPDPDTTPNSGMCFADQSMIQLSVTKRLNGENFAVDVSLL